MSTKREQVTASLEALGGKLVSDGVDEYAITHELWVIQTDDGPFWVAVEVPATPERSSLRAVN